MKKNYSATYVAERLEEAYMTLKRLNVGRVKPDGYKCNWPEIKLSIMETLQQDKKPIRLGSPTPELITRMEETFKWLTLIDSINDRKILMLKASKIPSKITEELTSRSRSYIWQRWKLLTEKLANKLNNIN